MKNCALIKRIYLLCLPMFIIAIMPSATRVMTLYFSTILLFRLSENGTHFHQRKTENVLSTPFVGVKSLLLIEPYTARPDGITVRTFHKPGISGFHQFLFQIVVL